MHQSWHKRWYGRVVGSIGIGIVIGASGMGLLLGTANQIWWIVWLCLLLFPIGISVTYKDMKKWRAEAEYLELEHENLRLELEHERQMTEETKR